IVEVLICIAIVSTVLGGAFVATRSSQLGVRNSQEHTTAIKLLENQLEQLRSNSGGDATIFTHAGAFCMFNEEPALTSSGNCNLNAAGAVVAATVQPSYSMTVTGCNNAGCGNSVANSDLFTAQASWNQVTGSGKGTETMVYRLYQ